MPSQVIAQNSVITKQVAMTPVWQKVLVVPFPHMLVSRIHINNCSNKGCAFRACYVHPSASPNINNAVLWDYMLNPNDYIQFGDGEILDRDWSIQVSLTVSQTGPVTFFLSAYGLAES